MARKVRAAKIETRAARLRLAPRGKPYHFTPIAPGKAIGYRRLKGKAGPWVLRVADGKGGNWISAIGHADDYADAGGAILTWWQAVEKGLKLVRGDETGKPATVAEALDAYQADLVAHGHAIDNATRARKRTPPALAAKTVALLRETDLSKWRDNLLAGGIKKSTLARIIRGFRAALNLAARRDKRIQNSEAWRDGLSGVSDKYVSRNISRLADDQVHAVTKAAYAIDHCFGLLTEVAAQTGARISQIARLTVADLLLEDGPPRLAMPSSKKGSRRGAPYEATNTNVPISATLAQPELSN
jgi:hypothetical protein